MPNTWPSIVQFLENYIPLINNTMAEVKEFKGGLLYYLGHNLLPLTMEIDSVTIKILDGFWEVPWIISIDNREIMEAMENKAVTIVHTFREGNKLADYLTNIIHQTQHDHFKEFFGRRRAIPGGVVVEFKLGAEEVFNGIDFMARQTGHLTGFTGRKKA
ncbi:hypothetical protein KY289_016824 [Solanum tuberosum]|nr:hypothetical protein KY289_016824 [Solanum tuberosum]